MRTIFTSESVTEGHPDKIADQISDSVLDAFLAADPNSRVACEVLVNTGLVVVSGEITSKADYIDIQSIARNRIIEIGYNHGDMCFDGRSCAVLTAIDEQSPDIAQGVNELPDHLQGAGDQGMMFGFACDQTPELMPLPIALAHKLSRRLAVVRKDGTLPYLRPDGKVQVSVEYEDETPVRVAAVVVSTQHAPEVTQAQIHEDIKRVVVDPILGSLVDAQTLYHINPTGIFVIGGPQGDCGLTGRKIIVDTYGGMGRHGGGAFSGKDPSKVDRSAAYMARHIAKSLVGNNLARKCEVQLAYAIGVAEPVSVRVDTFGTSSTSEEKLASLVREKFPLRPKELIDYLDLKRPIYTPTAAYGHFGREDLDVRWEDIASL
ncbi:methionine adenosyltransferase [bacterium]|nr:methionine adenosyltransferase [bacterium]NCQ55340.1 methionine adenosyltransferase [Candidatus Parcubacteria bacterium]NCS67147.1 methionine adenosyltransferase [Candidatus Peregrinibacteria bacterium]NCS96773.1 methionine adenosyltransferase [bacterium]